MFSLSRNYSQIMDKRRGRPFPDAVILKPLAFNLEEALQVENLFRPNLLAINQHGLKPGEVTLNSRDEAVSILRFLRVWFDLPHSVFFSAVSYLDMFLARMKVSTLYFLFLYDAILLFVTGARKIFKMLNIKLSSFGN